MKSGLQIAQEAKLKHISEIAELAGLRPDEYDTYGPTKAKITPGPVIERLKDRPDAKIVVCTAITPTKAGEGKTTTSVSLTQGLGKIGKSVSLVLREPSMGPVFGIKGGGNGGGYAQVLPMEEIDLHFNGDFHAVTTAHNLLSSAIDQSLMWDNWANIDPSTISWPGCIDMDARELRFTVQGLGGKLHGVPREKSWVITAASEVMAILALTSDLKDLRERLGRIVVASTKDGKPVTAEDLKAAGAMAVVLRDALRPNLVQTMEGQPVLIHAGPFGNIAHANNSIIADRIAMKMGDIMVTEGGFASDLGFEKFAQIVCRSAGFKPSAAVLVSTIRALKSHGGVPFDQLGEENVDALRTGMENLAAHADIMKAFNVRFIIALNERTGQDTDREIGTFTDLAGDMGAFDVVRHEGFAKGGDGAIELAEAVVKAVDYETTFAPINEPTDDLKTQIENIATRIYGADGVDYLPQAEKDIVRMGELGFGTAPVCMAKTHLSLAHDPLMLNRPKGWRLPIRAVVPSAGAGFVVPLCGDMQRMPAFGRTPAYMNIDIDEQGNTIGLY
jgi:formate--tetrahydrofolate ligase